MSLRHVSKETKRIEIGDEDWLEVRTDISRRAFNNLLMTLPVNRDGIVEDDIDLTTASNFSAALFQAFVTDWSVIDDKGRKTKATIDNYYDLSRDAASLIDVAVIEHFNSMTPNEQESTKSEGDSEE